MSDRHQRRRRVLAVLLARQAHERPAGFDERAARSELYPGPTQIDIGPTVPPLNEARPHSTVATAGGRAHELVFDELDSSA